MAKFKQGNLILKDNKKVLFGDDEDISLYYDGQDFKISDQQIGEYISLLDKLSFDCGDLST